MARPREETLTATGGSLLGPGFRPLSARRGNIAWYSAVTPSSLKREAMVPNTGMLSGAWPNNS